MPMARAGAPQKAPLGGFCLPVSSPASSLAIACPDVSTGLVSNSRRRKKGQPITSGSKLLKAFSWRGGQVHKRMDMEILNYLETTPNEKIDDFIKFLCHIEKYIDHFR